MASQVGTENLALTEAEKISRALEEVGERLYAEPYSFDFFQAIRLLERLNPGRKPIGRDAQPWDEVVRVGTYPTLSFPASQIQTLAAEKGGPSRMEVNFMGLFGAIGAMPTFLTELITTRIRYKDRTLLEFLNLFNHRLISFFYRAWEKNHFTIGYERDGDDPLTRTFYALVGFGTPKIRFRQPLRDETFVFYSGLYGMAPRSATAFESVLADYFGVPIEIEQFIGTWRRLEDRDQCVFGMEFSASASLGEGVVVGHEVWDQQSRARIRIGPLTSQRYREFLPTGSAWPALKAITRTFYGNDLEFEVQLVLRRDDVPVCDLGKLGDEGPQLGWYTWIKSKPRFQRDADDTILLINMEA